MFADNLKREMERAGLTVESLAVRLQNDHGITVTAGAVDHWINGRRSTNVATMQAISAILGVTLDALLVRAAS